MSLRVRLRRLCGCVRLCASSWSCRLRPRHSILRGAPVEHPRAVGVNQDSPWSAASSADDGTKLTGRLSPSTRAVARVISMAPSLVIAFSLRADVPTSVFGNTLSLRRMSLEHARSPPLRHKKLTCCITHHVWRRHTLRRNLVYGSFCSSCSGGILSYFWKGWEGGGLGVRTD